MRPPLGYDGLEQGGRGAKGSLWRGRAKGRLALLLLVLLLLGLQQ